MLVLIGSSILGPQQLQDREDQIQAGTQAIIVGWTVVASPSKAYVGQEVTFYVNATSDILNSTITARIAYDAVLIGGGNNTASPWDTNVTTNPANIVFRHTYNEKGNLTDAYNSSYVRVRVWIQDNESSTVGKTIRVDVNLPNRAPEWIQAPDNPVIAKPGENKTLAIIVQDPDNDPLTVNWDFGDGTTAIDNLTGTSSGAAVSRNHSWNPVIVPSELEYYVPYFMNISVYDGAGHWLNFTSFVNVTVSRNWEPEVNFYAVPNRVKPGIPITFVASVKDREGDPITWEFDWGDGSPPTSYYTPKSGGNVTQWYNQTRLYESHDNQNDTQYIVTLHIKDALPTRNVSYPITVAVIPPNRAPTAPEIRSEPQFLLLNITVGYLNVTFYIDVADLDGDQINATWDMGDGSAPRLNTTAKVDTGITQERYRQWRNFTDPAHFNVSVTVTDGILGHTVVRWLNGTVVSNNKGPEEMLAPTWTYKSGAEARPGEMINFTLKVADKEHDALTVVWDFGDNSSLLVVHYNKTDFDTEGNLTCNASHAYAVRGEYKIRIWITDNILGLGNHNLSINASVTVKEEQIQERMVWDWWDYTSLGLFTMIPIAFVVYGVFVIYKRRKMDKEGINWDEYRIKKQAGLEEE